EDGAGGDLFAAAGGGMGGEGGGGGHGVGGGGTGGGYSSALAPVGRAKQPGHPLRKGGHSPLMRYGPAITLLCRHRGDQS
ncbi:MAG: hypothetical protein WD942_02075, partial [Dehalococcoidia bacterium]